MITRIIHIDYKHCYGRSNLIVVNSLNFVVNNFSTSRASSRIFLSKSINFIDLFTFKKCSSILDSMALSHFNGVRAHHNFFVCSWFIIVQNQSFVYKSFIWSQSKPYLQGSMGTSISMTITLCRHGSYDLRGRFRNHFRCCATLIIMLRFINLIKFYCPPTQNTSLETISWK